MRHEEEKETATDKLANKYGLPGMGNFRNGASGAGTQQNGAGSEFTSTYRSLDLPPEEYEQQLQDYEAEVRNHIKIEQ